MRRRGAFYLLLIATLVIAILAAACGAEPGARPPATPTPSPAPSPTATLRPTVTAVLGDDVELVSPYLFISDRHGLTWRVPSTEYRFSDNPFELPGIVPLVILVSTARAEQQVGLFCVEQPPTLAVVLRDQLRNDPDLARAQIAHHFGLDPDELEIVEIAGSPGVVTTIDDYLTTPATLVVLVGPSHVFGALAVGFEQEQEALALLDTLTIAEPSVIARDDAPTPRTRDEQTAELIALAESIRGLEANDPVEIEYLDRDALRVAVDDYIHEHALPDDIVAEARLLVLLGLLPHDADLLTMLVDLYATQLGGSYIAFEDRFYLVAEEGGVLGPFDRVTFVHEYVHALQDQHLGLDALVAPAAEAARSRDESLAIQALIEGDAQLAAGEYLVHHCSVSEVEAILDGSASGIDYAVYRRTPRFLRELMTFPYVSGLEFVQYAWAGGDWEAVNALWDEPPLSTEQVLHPERYPDEIPIDVSLPPGLEEALGDGWNETLRDVMGEFELYLLLDKRALEAIAPEIAADGWGGDEFVLLTDDQHALFVARFEWDSERDAIEAWRALDEWLRRSGIAPVSLTRYAGVLHVAFLARHDTSLYLAIADHGVDLDVVLEALGTR